MQSKLNGSTPGSYRYESTAGRAYGQVSNETMGMSNCHCRQPKTTSGCLPAVPTQLLASQIGLAGHDAGDNMFRTHSALCQSNQLININYIYIYTCICMICIHIYIYTCVNTFLNALLVWTSGCGVQQGQRGSHPNGLLASRYKLYTMV